MSSALERLKQLAAAKKAAEAAEVKQDASPSTAQETPATVPEVQAVEVPTEVQDSQTEGTSLSCENAPSEETNSLVPASSASGEKTRQGNDHPLLMELASLEQALTEKLPEFRTILRDIHQKLRNDPDIVTVLSEEEIGLIVSGLATHANAEIVAPKAAKTLKAKLSAAKKAPISASAL